MDKQPGKRFVKDTDCLNTVSDWALILPSPLLIIASGTTWVTKSCKNTLVCIAVYTYKATLVPHNIFINNRQNILLETQISRKIYGALVP